MTKVRVGIIGAGAWTLASHLPNLASRQDEVEFVGVSRIGMPELLGVQRDFGFSMASEDYREVIGAGLDLAVVASPAALHFEHAQAALMSGAHVLIEKPMTVDSSHAWSLVELADKESLHLVVALGWHYLPMVIQAKRLLDDVGVGQVEHVSIRMASATRELLCGTGSYVRAHLQSPPSKRTWNDPKLSGGGYAQAQLSHAIGLAAWLLDLRCEEVFAHLSSPQDAPVELHASLSMRFTSGAIGSMAGSAFSSSASNTRHQLDIRIVGSEGHFELDLERDLVRLDRNDGSTRHLDLEPGAGVYNCDGPLHTAVDLALGRGVENLSSGVIGARTVEVLEAAYRSAESRTIATLTQARL